MISKILIGKVIILKMINLLNNNNLKKIILILLIVNINTKSLNSSENKIIFKINNKVFTSLDYQNRLKFIDFIGDNQEINRDIIINDFISANLFFEYYKSKKQKTNYDTRINEIYTNIEKINNQNNKKYKYKLNKEIILSNIKIDFIRKIVLEDLINANKENFRKSNDELDLLYKFKIRYLNLKKDRYAYLKNIYKIAELNNNNLIDILKKQNIDFFVKEKEINNINNIDPRIRKNLISNNDFFIIENNTDISIIFVEKTFETLDGLIGDIYSVRSENTISEENLLCENLIKNKNKYNIINKEYYFSDLNNKLKENLISVNDYVEMNDNTNNIYIVLCNIRFDKEKLNNLNFNKLINKSVSEMENEFIETYSKIYNLEIFDE